MKDKLINRINELTAERDEIIAKMGDIKKQIAELNRQGEQLAQRGNFLNGKIEQNKEWLSEFEDED